MPDETKKDSTETTQTPDAKTTVEKHDEAGKPEVHTEKTTVEKTKQ